MCPHIACPRWCIVTLVAFVWLFSFGHFQMNSQIACTIGCIVTLVAFVWLFSTVFSNVPLNCLPEKRYSHIGCICSTFLHCVSSNVSSNGLPERMHSYIGCICLTFLHCVFSNDSAKYLHKRKQSYIGCICLTFPHYGLGIHICVLKWPAWVAYSH